jgi:N-methylhydantoinase B
MPNAMGLAGGLPGAAVRALRVADSDVANRLQSGEPLPTTIEEAGGHLEVLEPKHPRTPLGSNDIWYHSWQAGAGFGDPLDRDPEAVERDVRNLAVSPAAAGEIYGVVIKDGRLNLPATEDRRAQMRRERIGREPKAQQPAAPGRLIGDLLLVQENGETRCARCGEPLGFERAVGARAAAQVIETSLDPAGPHRGQDYGDLGFRLQRRVCPGCGSQIHAELVYRGERLVEPPGGPVEPVAYVRRVEGGET